MKIKITVTFVEIKLRDYKLFAEVLFKSQNLKYLFYTIIAQTQL